MAAAIISTSPHTAESIAPASVGPSNVGMGTEVGWGQLEYTLVLGDSFFDLITQLVDAALSMHDRISSRSIAYNRDKLPIPPV